MAANKGRGQFRPCGETAFIDRFAPSRQNRGKTTSVVKSNAICHCGGRADNVARVTGWCQLCGRRVGQCLQVDLPEARVFVASTTNDGFTVEVDGDIVGSECCTAPGVAKLTD